MQHHDHHEHEHSHRVSKLLTGLAIGGAVTAAAIIAAPYVLPAIGLGDAETALESMSVLHNMADAGGGKLAGSINSVLAAVPLIGDSLAAGGFYNALATGVVGIGGVLLGNFVAKREDGSKKIKWGSVIKTAALIASALIALPTMLTMLGTGLIFASTLAGDVGITSSVVGMVGSTIGTMGNMENAMYATSGLLAAVPHFITCGASIIPAALGLSMFRASRRREKQSPPQLHIEAELRQPTQAEQPAEVLIRLKDATTGRALTPEDLSTVHTEKIHLLVVDQSLKDYHHLHPEYTGAPGEFRFNFTPATSNRYRVWADVTPNATNQQAIVSVDLPARQQRHIPPVIRPTNLAQKEDIVATISSDAPLRKNAPQVLRISLADQGGKPLRDLEPVMGAYAHLVGFSEDGQSVIHAHPMGQEPKNPGQRGGPDLLFHLEPARSGGVQFYLQLRRNGKEVMLPFGARVLEPEQTATAARQQSHHVAQVSGKNCAAAMR